MRVTGLDAFIKDRMPALLGRRPSAVLFASKRGVWSVPFGIYRPKEGVIVEVAEDASAPRTGGHDAIVMYVSFTGFETEILQAEALVGRGEKVVVVTCDCNTDVQSGRLERLRLLEHTGGTVVITRQCGGAFDLHTIYNGLLELN